MFFVCFYYAWLELNNNLKTLIEIFSINLVKPKVVKEV